MTYQFIDHTDDLVQFCQSIESSPWLAIDTEFVRTDTYFPILSLIQTQNPEGISAIIDPIAIDDLSPLWALLQNPHIVKVFHSARQDLEVLYQVSGHLPVNIFDTQIACLFLGHGDLAGLGRVVAAELNIKLEKDQTRTDWQQRPLTEQQLAYAIDDVRTLAPLYEKCLSQLTPEQLDALQQDFDALLDIRLYELSPEAAGAKIKATHKLSRKNRAIAYRLAEWRERHAIEHNQPKRWVLSDDVLVAIAKRPPDSVEALYKVPHIKPASIKRYGETWIKEIDDVFAHPDLWPTPPPPVTPPTPQEAILLDVGFAWANQMALIYHINPHNVINRTDLLAIIRQPGPVLLGWRHLLIEKPLRDFLDGKTALSYDNHQLLQKNVI
jgi:ribonuclease D